MIDIFIIDLTKSFNGYMIMLAILGSFYLMTRQSFKIFGGLSLFLIGFILLFNDFNMLLSILTIISGVFGVIYQGK